MAAGKVGAPVANVEAKNDQERANKRAKVEVQKSSFLAVFQRLCDEVVDDLKESYEGLPDEAIEWVRENIQYNVPHGKLNRGMSVVASFESIKRAQTGKEVSEGERLDAAILGWCVEWLQAFFLVADDIMDGSITRRGQPCWYKKNKVGLVAINDSFILEAAIYKILERHFADRAYYLELLVLFREVTYKTELGQMLDLITAPEDHIDLSKFSMDKYKNIVKYKTAYYSFYLPVALGMMMAGVGDKAELKEAEKILLVMGEFFQVQDDFLDCYGAPEVIGKIGTDIEDNKCGWLINQALLRTNAQQRQLLDANYGQKDPKCVAVVKGVFAELELEKLFREYEDESFAELQKLIAARKGSIPAVVYTDFADKIYKRNK